MPCASCGPQCPADLPVQSCFHFVGPAVFAKDNGAFVIHQNVGGVALNVELSSQWLAVLILRPVHAELLDELPHLFGIAIDVNTHEGEWIVDPSARQ